MAIYSTIINDRERGSKIGMVLVVREFPLE